MLTHNGCHQRQQRLVRQLELIGLDSVLLTDCREIYYFTGLLLNPAGAAAEFPALLRIASDGSSWLVSHTTEGDALVDERFTYEPALMATMNPDPLKRLNEVVTRQVAGQSPVSRIGFQAESMPFVLGETIAQHLRPDSWVPIDESLQQMQKPKDPDEVILLRKAISCNLSAYDASSAAIAEGITELAVEETGHAAATVHAEQIVFHNGDYQCGQSGGFARNRQIQSGELYIIDAWTRTRGYWSDLCRTFAVDTIAPLQQEVYEHIAQALSDVHAEIRPGRTGDEIWRFLDTRLRKHPHLRESGLIHHAGHGIGLRAHEAPDLNRDRGGLLEPGDVICVEPGAYSEELRGGIRLENTFLVTETGAELLSDYPLKLS